MKINNLNNEVLFNKWFFSTHPDFHDYFRDQSLVPMKYRETFFS